LAARLTAAGLRVVMLEEGGYYTRNEFSLNEGVAFPMLYQEQGARATDDLAIVILQGRNVGGGTTVNWTTCFRTPEHILEHWRVQYGVEGIDKQTLAPHFEKIEARLNIHEWPKELVNANNDTLRRGCEALGWQVELLRRNVKGCADSGYCGFGCPVDAKQAMHLTFIPDALAAGLTLCANTHATHFELDGQRIVAVHANVLHPDREVQTGATLRVKAKVFVSSAGAINGPALLLRSGLNHNGRVGSRTLLHPVCSVSGVYPHPIRAWYGAPQSVASHQFVDRGEDKVGFFMEVPPFHPMLAATAGRGFGHLHATIMRKLEHVSPVIAICVDGLGPHAPGGQVSLRPDGRPKISYTIGPAMQEAFRAAHHAITELHFAAGCTEVYSLHEETITLRSLADRPLLDKAPYGNLDLAVFSAHQMGGCAMGTDPEQSVVDSTLRHHHVPNLFIVDGSVFPTALGVNPSLSIYGLASLASENVGNAV
jgi:choline dehydrogenase-like flavoprotein